MGTHSTATDLRTQLSGYPSNTAPYRWFEAHNPVLAQANSGEGLLMQAYALSLVAHGR